METTTALPKITTGSNWYLTRRHWCVQGVRIRASWDTVQISDSSSSR
jgi:hypothetical protein